MLPSEKAAIMQPANITPVAPLLLHHPHPPPMPHPHPRIESRVVVPQSRPEPTPTLTAAMEVARLSSGVPIPLPSWSQTAPRDFVSYALCFPFEGSATKKAEAECHLRYSLARLAAARPEFAGRLRLSTDPTRPGQLVWTRSPKKPIYATFTDISSVFSGTYAKLRDQGFPPAAFADPLFRLGINANPAAAQLRTNGATASTPADEIDPCAVPVVVVRAFFIADGLFLLVHLHHAFGDGDCMRVLLDCMAAATRDCPVPPHPPNWTLDLPDIVERALVPPASTPVRDLVRACPEYLYVPETLIGPTQPVLQPGGVDMASVPTDSRVFVFGEAKLAALRQHLRSPDADPAVPPPTNYVCISALAWSHITLARWRAEPGPEGKSTNPSLTSVATLSNPLGWRPRMEPLERTMPGTPRRPVSGYFGNATAKCLTQVPTWQLLAAAAMATTPGATADAHLRAVAAAVRANIAAADSRFVDVRTRLYAALPDPRALGLSDDPRRRDDLQVNTWRPFGADAAFSIPGVDKGRPSRPESVRKAMVGGKGGRCDYRNVLMMPARADSKTVELFVSLPRDSLERLCTDEGWLRWVDRVVG